MNRRGFLNFLAPAAIGAVVAADLTEELLWTPSRRFFLPPVGGWRGNPLLTCSWIIPEAIKILENNLYIAQRIKFDGFVGNTVNIRRPPRYAQISRELILA